VKSLELTNVADTICCQFAGILVAKKSLFVNPVPSGCGGGSVFFVSTEKIMSFKGVQSRFLELFWPRTKLSLN